MSWCGQRSVASASIIHSPTIVLLITPNRFCIALARVDVTSPAILLNCLNWFMARYQMRRIEYCMLKRVRFIAARPKTHDWHVRLNGRTQVHSAQSSLAVTHPSSNRARRYLTSVTESPSKHWSPTWHFSKKEVIATRMISLSLELVQDNHAERCQTELRRGTWPEVGTAASRTGHFV